LNKPHNLNLVREGGDVPESWDPACYRERATTSHTRSNRSGAGHITDPT